MTLSGGVVDLDAALLVVLSPADSTQGGTRLDFLLLAALSLC